MCVCVCVCGWISSQLPVQLSWQAMSNVDLPRFWIMSLSYANKKVALWSVPHVSCFGGGWWLVASFSSFPPGNRSICQKCCKCMLRCFNMLNIDQRNARTSTTIFRITPTKYTTIAEPREASFKPSRNSCWFEVKRWGFGDKWATCKKKQQKNVKSFPTLLVVQ